MIRANPDRNRLEGRALSLQQLAELLESISHNLDPVLNLFQVSSSRLAFEDKCSYHCIQIILACLKA